MSSAACHLTSSTFLPPLHLFHSCLWFHLSLLSPSPYRRQYLNAYDHYFQYTSSVVPKYIVRIVCNTFLYIVSLSIPYFVASPQLTCPQEKSWLDFAMEQDYLATNQCRLAQVEQQFFSAGFGWALQEDSLYLQLFNSEWVGTDLIWREESKTHLGSYI